MPPSPPEILFDERHRFQYGKSAEFYVAAGRLRFPAPDAKRLATRKGFPDFRFMYLLEGGGTFVSPRGERLRLSPGDLVCRRPRLDHQMLPDGGKLWREFYLVLPPTLAAAFEEAGLLPEGDYHPLGLDASMERAMAGIGAAVRGARSFAPLLSELGDFLSFIKQRTERTRLGAAELRRIEQAKGILSQGLEENLSMRQLSRRLGLDYDLFRKRFKAATGMAPKEFRLRKKLAAAAAMLTEGDTSVSSVSEALGYPDVFCFSRQFKAHFHSTPSEYRRGWR
ncbi:MAG: helix-turn-helix transcriptional regulator [Spirochaetes bacterium]|nr:helix-turn-helix transcriptional regulator [Spirochaetota bacterium]